MSVIIVASLINFIVLLYSLVSFNKFNTGQKLIFFIFLLNIFLKIYISFVPGGLWGNCCNPYQLEEGGALYLFSTIILALIIFFYRGLKNLKPPKKSKIEEVTVYFFTVMAFLIISWILYLLFLA